VSTLPPIRREVLVDAGPETAFDVFTAGIGRWWPVAGHSVHGAGGTVAFTGGQLMEQSASGHQSPILLVNSANATPGGASTRISR